MRFYHAFFNGKLFFMLAGAIFGQLLIMGSAFAFTAPVLDGKLDDVYLQYGTVTRYSDMNTYEPTGESNVASAYLYSVETPTHVYIYYYQDKFYQNDTSYGDNSIHWEVRPNGKRNLFDIWESDRGEFIFMDAIGDIAGHFYVDQISPVGGTPSGYECLGFSGGDGAWLAGDVANQAYFEITSTMDYNLNSTGYCAGGVCDCGGVDLLENSPVGSDSYVTADPACSDWIWESGWEIKIDKQAFGILGYGWAIGNHHNSPTKMCEKTPKCRAILYLATSSIGDRVWLDANANGVQDTGEVGLQGVTVELVDPRDGSVVESRVTGPNGAYLFKYLSNEYYILRVDTSTLLPGFINTTDNSSPSDYHTSYLNGPPDNPCLLTEGCIQRDGQAYADIYYVDLEDNQFYHGADFGFVPTGASIGDYVWSDADQDGFQDAGEPGIGSVLVELLDAGLNPITTTMTTPAGWYLFTGLDAGGYKVRIADSNLLAGGTLEGYTLTQGAQSSGNPTLTITLETDQQFFTADFGYYTPSGSIGDYVWYDVNNDGVQDPGESGVNNVTVDLYIDNNADQNLDSGDSFIAQAVTDITGSYTFTGVPLGDEPGGAHYMVTVSDAFGVLNLFALTTYDFTLNRYNDPYPVNLTPSNTSNMNADFGFNNYGSIGDMVWLDANQNGVMDSGERGVGGITVTLLVYGKKPYEIITTTSPGGSYMFSDLEPGDFSVSITVPPDYTLSCTTADDPCTGAYWTPIPHDGITLAGRQSYLSADFALYQPTYTLGDLVWYDDNEDGVPDPLEERAENVTLALYQDVNGDGVIDPTEPVIATETTDANGFYVFSNLQNGNYIVKVTDSLSILQGCTLTTDNEPFPVTINDVGVSDADFGFKRAQPTRAILRTFRAFESGQDVVVLWETASEADNVGFYLYQRNRAGTEAVMGQGLLPGLMVSHAGGSYQYIDRNATGEACAYRLEEVEARSGICNRLGETTVASGGFSKQGEAALLPENFAQALTSEYSFSPAQANYARGSGLTRSTDSQARRAKAWPDDTAAWIYVNQTGLYRLDASELAAMLGITEAEVMELIAQSGVSLTLCGQDVAWLPDDDASGLYFFGVKRKDIYASDNVYHVSKGSGLIMEEAQPRSNSGSYSILDKADDIGCFLQTIATSLAVVGLVNEDVFINARKIYRACVRIEENNWDISQMFDDPESDFWIWETIYSGYDGYDTKTFSFSSDNVCTPTDDQAVLTVHLHGGSNSGAAWDHHAQVAVNGVAVGEGRFCGTSAYTMELEFSQEILHDGENTVEIKGVLDHDVPYSGFFVDFLDICYTRYYVATDNHIEIPGDGNPAVTARCFDFSDILVLDVAYPRKPAQVSKPWIEDADDGYNVRFCPPDPNAPHVIWAKNAHLAPAFFEIDIPSDLCNPENRADYIIITPDSLEDAAITLAEHRRGQGLEAMVVRFRDILDEFNHGISSPKAIRDFLYHAYLYWEKAPRYVLLAGKGTLDYKNYTGYGDNLIPPMLVGTPHGLFASDARFVSFTDSGKKYPMAIGRLPVVTPEEFLTVIDKIKAYENAESENWTRRVLMAADDPDLGGGFSDDSDSVSLLVPQEYAMTKVYMPQFTAGQAKDLVVNSINDGLLLINYIGHAGLDRLADGEGMLTTDDVPLLANGCKLPFISAMSCVVGQSLPGFISLSEKILLHENGGAVGVWAPTGLSYNEEAVELARELFRAVFVDGNQVIGDAVTQALNSCNPPSDLEYMTDIYILFGDPALRLH